jgi:2-octaprenyl-6-methoxyphenol hydroxylase
VSAKTATYDVVIAGGGMVGASLALALSRYSEGALSVLLVESFPLPTTGAAPVYRPSFDARSTALSYGSRQILDSVGVWAALHRHLTPITCIHVSDRGHIGSALLTAQEQGWDALGYVVENAWLGNVLLNALHAAPGVECRSPASVTAVEEGGDLARLLLNNTRTEDRGAEAETILCRLLAVADGAQSGLRSALGIAGKVVDYAQHAVIANVCFEKPHGGIAYERFTDQGPLALLPLANSEQGESRAALVWTLSSEDAASVLAVSDEAFLAQLQKRFGYRQGRLLRVGERASFPLQLVEAEEQVRPNIVVMGNAAHSLHPVAGQGFNLALRDVARLARRLAQTSTANLGELAQLRAYLNSQHKDQRSTVELSHQLPALFARNNSLFSLGRNLGLLALDVLPSAKSRFVEQAAGLAPGNARG